MDEKYIEEKQNDLRMGIAELEAKIEVIEIDVSKLYYQMESWDLVSYLFNNYGREEVLTWSKDDYDHMMKKFVQKQVDHIKTERMPEKERSRVIAFRVKELGITIEQAKTYLFNNR